MLAPAWGVPAPRHVVPGRGYNRDSDRSLVLRSPIYRGRPLNEREADEVLRHLGRLWGFQVRLESIDEQGRVDSTREWRP